MTAPDLREAGRWGDLPKRLISAGVMVVVGAVDIWLGGLWFIAMILVLTGIMIWELAAMTAPAGKVDSVSLGIMGAMSLFLVLAVSPPISLAGFLLLPLGFMVTPRIGKMRSATAALLIIIAGYGLVRLRDDAGTSVILWLIAVVIASDVLGYFAGRILGGPKFWPQISPKKTWSGTVAGWLGAGMVGGVFVYMGMAPLMLIPLSMLVAFAGQMGDIGESWIKRRAGVKDSSNLIPGHGGVMDRFDALTGAVVAVVLLNLAFALPLPVAQ